MQLEVGWMHDNRRMHILVDAQKESHFEAFIRVRTSWSSVNLKLLCSKALPPIERPRLCRPNPNRLAQCIAMLHVCLPSIICLTRKAPFDNPDRFFEKFVAVGIDLGTTYVISLCRKPLCKSAFAFVISIGH
jgi:hypothetical protein